ncbi:MAG: DUF3052 domain-containing protein [Galactobacter sp.]|mgnify:CR=1 FL=1|uniref:DUF3052 domain-containing protein n=1 Tax=Galactobacter sp. TaxID=2676125 RepID=UPI0025BCF5BB|nr:DUF3052 domain-containing protein [Galactobacter sp.]
MTTVSDAKAPQPEPQHGAAQRMGLKPGDLVQELGYDDDVDFDLRDDIEQLTGEGLLDEDEHDVCEAVILWWRDDDGDLVDALVDSLTDLSDDGVVWLLTPKLGQDGHVSAVEIQEAAPTAGLHSTSTEGVSSDWQAARLVPRRNH